MKAKGLDKGAFREVAAIECNGIRITIAIKDGRVVSTLEDMATGFVWADGPLMTVLVLEEPDKSSQYTRLSEAEIQSTDCGIDVTGMLGPIRLTYQVRLWRDTALRESVCIANTGDAVASVSSLRVAHRRHIAGQDGDIIQELAKDRLRAVPFLHHPTEASPRQYEYRLEGMENLGGDVAALDAGPRRYEFRFGELLERRGVELYHPWRFAGKPANDFASEAWAWTRQMPGGVEHVSLLVSTQSDDHMLFSLIGPLATAEGIEFVFGGIGGWRTEPQVLRDLQPGTPVELGIACLERVPGGYHEAAYAYRRLLDARGNRFPGDYNPPVHWNELYDNPFWHITEGKTGSAPPRDCRAAVYTLEDMKREAVKAVAYGCESLYLDPGWDNYTGDFLWGTGRLGAAKDFCGQMRREYGLGVSLHTPLATWCNWNKPGIHTYADVAGACMKDADGTPVQWADGPEHTPICLASRQYIDQASARLVELCESGVTFLMFDGNGYSGVCYDPGHGHSIPLTREDNCRACVEIAKRVHEKHPDVLIEMHDMVVAGYPSRYTPVYYKHSEPRSYDENWAFEFMWRPLHDLKAHRARSLYYYNLACNVPLYVHIDLRDDNEHCTMLWWYASTCRHMGIGGTHRDPMIAEAQRRAMQKYRKLKPYFARGGFYGIPECSEQVHIHVLPDRRSAVINAFNLSDETREIHGEIALEAIGLPLGERYINPAPHYAVASDRGHLVIRRTLPPWGHEVAELYSIDEAALSR